MTKEQKLLRAVGFWHDEHNPKDSENRGYPHYPVGAKPTEKHARFALKLKAIQDEYASVVNYRGFSKCRVCGCANGSAEYTLTYSESDLDFKWPSGLMHYITVHGYKPPKDFIDMVVGIYKERATI